MLKLIRETPWVKEWQTPIGNFVDSKLRWLGVEPNAQAFLVAWRRADGAGRQDLEAAFEFWPYELHEDIEEILREIASEDPARAERMRKRLFGPGSILPDEQQRFLSLLGEHLQRTNAPMRMIGENKFFAAYANDAGFHIETKVTGPFDMPTDEELQDQIDAALSIAWRRILITVRENRWLIEARPGENALPM